MGSSLVSVMRRTAEWTVDEFDPDPMLAILSELEMPYLANNGGWDWDKPMPPAEWAISTS